MTTFPRDGAFTAAHFICERSDFHAERISGNGRRFRFSRVFPEGEAVERRLAADRGADHGTRRRSVPARCRGKLYRHRHLAADHENHRRHPADRRSQRADEAVRHSRPACGSLRGRFFVDQSGDHDPAGGDRHGFGARRRGHLQPFRRRTGRQPQAARVQARGAQPDLPSLRLLPAADEQLDDRFLQHGAARQPVQADRAQRRLCAGMEFASYLLYLRGAEAPAAPRSGGGHTLRGSSAFSNTCRRSTSSCCSTVCSRCPCT